MDKTDATARLHPLIAIAAVALILISLAGLAAITGMLPVSPDRGNSGTAAGSHDNGAISVENKSASERKATAAHY